MCRLIRGCIEIRSGFISSFRGRRGFFCGGTRLRRQDAGANAGVAGGPEGEPQEAASLSSAFSRATTTALDKLAPSLALALRAAYGVRVSNPANAVRFRGNDEMM